MPGLLLLAVGGWGIAVLSVAALVVVVLLLHLLGVTLPREHTARGDALVALPLAECWARVADVQGAKVWRSDLRRVEPRPEEGGPEVWIEHSRHGAMTIRLERAEPPRLRVTRIVDEGLPFGGTWTWTLSPEGERATRVTIVEDGFIKPPLFRVLARWVFGHDATIRKVLADLQRSATRE